MDKARSADMLLRDDYLRCLERVRGTYYRASNEFIAIQGYALPFWDVMLRDYIKRNPHP